MRARGFDLFLIGDEVFWKVSPVVQPGRIPFPLVETPQPARFRLFDAITSYNMYENGTASQNGYAASSGSSCSDVAAKYSEYLSAANALVYFVPQIIPGYNDRGVRMTENHYAIPREWGRGRRRSQPVCQTIRPHSISVRGSPAEHDPDHQLERMEQRYGHRAAGAFRSNPDRSMGKEYTRGYSYSGHGLRYLETLRNKVFALRDRAQGPDAVPGAIVRAFKGQRLIAETRADSSGRYRFSRLELQADGSASAHRGQAGRRSHGYGPPGTCITGINLER